MLIRKKASLIVIAIVLLLIGGSAIMASIGVQDIYYYTYMTFMLLAIIYVLSREEKVTDAARIRKGREIK